MEKAYDVKGLLEELKGQGVEVAEEAAKVVIKSVFSWVSKSAQVSQTPYDDMIAVILPKLEAYALEQADKINAQG
jgi:hypothetical protein